MSVWVLGPVACGGSPCAASAQMGTAALRTVTWGGCSPRSVGSAARICGADLQQMRWGEGSGDKPLPSGSPGGCVLSQAHEWAGAGVALIAFSLCPALKRLLFNEESSLKH